MHQSGRQPACRHNVHVCCCCCKLRQPVTSLLIGRHTHSLLASTVLMGLQLLQIAGDKLTQMAAQHWSEAARAKPDRPAFSPEIVEQIYRQELCGGDQRKPLLKRIMLLEVRGTNHGELGPSWGRGCVCCCQWAAGCSDLRNQI